MDPSAILERAKALVGVSDGDTLTRAALAVQNSEFGVSRRVDAIIAELENRNIPRITPTDVNAIRAIVMRVTGISIELDDPLLLLLVATQDVGLNRLKQSVRQHKVLEEKLRFNLWLYQTLFYSLAAVFVMEGCYFVYLFTRP